ncbi:nuclease subunit B-like protein [Salinarchaeum sp. Harcht-Bsk1]|uniref:PD-(D/E)XK nuclease family protein n=1 Tax=Salinarchaeum sp. Harcht-Bsk1 TaxID=1333523 RepID=UPI00034246D2|nr:PD-(D/E)XK nuclease family protein [Salinarchaeum sp. Harcht-Bsk1]AGN02387.1 nuclease subunit B-like protein [Salinarchaeum sp. Harcht-Bsk1]
MVGGCICYSPSYTALRDHAFNWLDTNTAESPESAVFLESNAHQRDAIATAWREEHDALRLTVTGIADFALTIHERLYGPYPGIETLERRRTIEQALHRLDENDVLRDAGQHTPSISELLRELEADGVRDIATLEDRLDSSTCTQHQQTVLTEVFEGYLELRGRIAHPESKTQNEKLAAVAETDQSLRTVLPHLDAIVISNLEDPSATELAVIERLAEDFPVRVLMPTVTPEAPTAGISTAVADTIAALRGMGFEEERVEAADPLPLRDVTTRLYQPVETPDAPPAELSWHEAPTPDREIRHVARRIREELATTDRQPDDLLVLAPGLLSYRDGIADVFDAYGIDHAYKVSILLERTYAGRAVLDAIECCEYPRSDRIAELATNPLVDIPGTDAVELADVQRRLYTTAIDAYVDELDASASGIDAFLDRVAAVREAEADAVVPAVRELLGHIGLESTVETLDENADFNAGYEARAVRRVDAILESVQTVCEEFDPDDPLGEVGTALEGVRVPSPTQVTAGNVEIIGLQDAPGADFEELYVLGATAQHLSGSETRPRFFQTLGEQLGVFERHAQRDVDRYRFGTLIGNAQRVHITTPETTIDDDPLLVSPFVDELARVTGLEPTGTLHDEPRASREDLQRDMAGAPPAALEPALAAARENGHVTDAFVATATRGAECGAHRGVQELTAHDGQLTTGSIESLDGKLTRAPYSYSRLTKYAKCGFKYLLSTGWGLDEEDDIEPGIDPLTLGSVVHETVETFYRDLQTEPGDPVDLTDHDQHDLEQGLLAAARDAVDDEDVSLHDVFGEKTLHALFSGLASPTENEYYSPPGNDSTDDPSGTFAQFLDTELDFAEDGHRPSYFEAELGDDDGVQLPDGRTVPVGGIVDRVDTTPDGLTVFDYKASSVNGARRRENQARDGIDFQLPIYSLAAPELVDTDLTPSDVAARYYVINDNPQVKPRRSLADRFDDIDYDAFITDVIPDRLDAVTGAIENGAFHPAVVGERTAQCSYCEFSDICDVRHHRRYDVVDHVTDTGHHAYVPAGAGAGDVLDELPGGDTDA